MPIPLELIGTGASLLGGALGNWLGGDEEAAARHYLDQALQEYQGLSLPELQALQAQEMGPSAYEGVPLDSGNLQARNRAIQALIDEGQQGGYSLQSRAEMDAARRAAGQDELQRRQAVLQQARARGDGGNAAILGQLAAQQAGADRTAAQGVQSAASARQRALSSLAQGGSMAGQAEESDFARKARIAEARDAIARFNAQQRQQAGLYNAGLAQQQFGNKMALAGAKAGALTGRAQGYQQDAQATRDIYGGLGDTVNAGIREYAKFSRAEEKERRRQGGAP